MIIWARSILFLIAWAILTLFIGVIGVPLLVSQRAMHWLSRRWVSGTLLLLCLCCGLRAQVQGREHLPKRGGIIAAKHQSTLDTLLLWRELGNPVFVLKKQLYLIPIFGWYLWRTGQIAIDRRDRRNAMRQVITGAQAALAAGRTLVIFPEGTRVKPGSMPLFHSGIARVSAALNQPVVPVALNHGLFWGKLSVRKHAGVSTMKALPPVPACGADQKLWLFQLHRLINDESARLEG